MGNCRVVLLILALLLMLPAAWADRVEDLEKKLDTAQGQERATVLNQLAEKLIESDPDRSLDYAQQAVRLGQELGLPQSVADGWNHSGYAWLQKSRPDQATECFKNADQAAKDSNYVKGQAYARNGYGMVWSALDDYARALDDYEKAMKLFVASGDRQGEAYVLNNMGTVYEATGAHDKALDYYLKALKINEAMKNQEELITTYNNIGSVNGARRNFQAAYDHYNKALELAEKLGSEKGIADTLENLGRFFLDYQYPDNAIEFYKKGLDLAEKTHSSARIAKITADLARAWEVKGDNSQALQLYEKAAALGESIGDVEVEVSARNNIGTIENRNGNFEKALKYHTEAFAKAKAVGFTDGLRSTLKNIAADYQAVGNFQQANHYMILYNELQAALQEQEQSRNFANAQVLYETEKKDQQIAEQNATLAANRKRALIMMAVIGISALFLLVVSVLAMTISKEKKKSERLLLNILPDKVARELKTTGKTEPERFESVTVLFSDIVGFTEISSRLEPAYLIGELNDIFTLFDGIMTKNGCERIKTIGDAYFAVSGMPAADPDHARNIGMAALEMLRALEERNSTSKVCWQIRIGLHSGPVVGGVVGVRKYIYDVFGDTVNTASRMENNSLPMRINVSETAHELLRDSFLFEEREPVPVKGKGLCTMYFLKEPV